MRSRRLAAFVAMVVVVAVAALVGLRASMTPMEEKGKPRRPNIVVLMTDDQTIESLRVMPHVRSLLADRGVTFDNSFVSFPLCCPSRTTYYTGQYAHNHHVTYNEGSTGGYHAFRERRHTVPVALERAGYDTVHIGKYLNGYGVRKPDGVPPGWTDWNGSVDPSTYRYYGFTLNENGVLHTYGPHDYQTDVYARLAVEKIRREAKAPGPFFLDLAFLAPHGVQRETSGLDPADSRAVGAPHMRHGIRYPVPAPRDLGPFAGARVPDLDAFGELDVSDKPLHIQARTVFTAAERLDIERNYRLRLETLLAVDRAVVRIVRALRATKQLDNTVIVFVSDNGFFHGEHRLPYGKYLPYEPAIRVPLIIRGPGIAEGQHTSALVNNVDLPATILKLAHAHAPRTPDGRSLGPLLRDPSAQWQRDAVLLESGPNDFAAPVYQGIRTRRYAYVEYETGERELYDLRTDLAELQNQAGSARYADVQARLAAELASVRACAGASCP